MKFDAAEVASLHLLKVMCVTGFVTNHGSVEVPSGAAGIVYGGESVSSDGILLRIYIDTLNAEVKVTKDEWVAHFEYFGPG